MGVNASPPRLMANGAGSEGQHHGPPIGEGLLSCTHHYRQRSHHRHRSARGGTDSTTPRAHTHGAAAHRAHPVLSVARCRHGAQAGGRQGEADQADHHLPTWHPPARRLPSNLTVVLHALIQPNGQVDRAGHRFRFWNATVPVTVAAATSSPPTSIYHGRNLPGTRKDAGQCAYYAGSRHHIGGFARFEMVLSRKCWPRVRSRAPSRPKTKAMAKLSGVTVALHVLHGTRWSSCFVARLLPRSRTTSRWAAPGSPASARRAIALAARPATTGTLPPLSHPSDTAQGQTQQPSTHT